MRPAKQAWWVLGLALCPLIATWGQSEGDAKLRLNRLDSLSKHHPNGYTAFFPVQRYVCSIHVPVDGPEVMSHEHGYNRQAIFTQGSRRGMYVTVSNRLHGRKRYRPLMDEVANQLLQEATRWGLDPVEVATSFVQSIPYVAGRTEVFPEETLAKYEGDCSDSSVLLQILLRRFGIRSDVLLWPYLRHATLGLPSCDRPRHRTYAHVECTNFTPIGFNSIEEKVERDLARMAKHSDRLPPSWMVARVTRPHPVHYESRGSECFVGLDTLEAQHEALNSALGDRHSSWPLAKRLASEEKWFKRTCSDSVGTCELLQDMRHAHTQFEQGRTALKQARDSLAKWVSFLESQKCIIRGEGDICDPLWERSERMASRIPDLEKDLVALAEEANKMRHAWNAVVARDPWLGGFDKSVMHIPEGRGEVPALGPCSDLSGEERQACTQGAILAMVTAELSYPEEALAEEVTGTAYVRFEVDLEGWVRRAKVLVGADPRLDREALRAVQSLPRFDPAHLDGEPVKMLYTVPVRFAIEQ